MQKYFNYIQNTNGQAVPGAIVLVKDSLGVTATIYSDNGVTQKQNPVSTNNLGYFEFYAADGKYDLHISGNTIDTQAITDVELDDYIEDTESYTSETQTATVGQTVFNLTTMNYVPGILNLSVYINGVRQAPSAYAETDTNTVTFTSGLDAGDTVQFVSSDAVSSTTNNADTTTYDQGGAGSVATNVGAKLRETISVKDFGAVGNGTTDDSGAIQAAIDAAAALAGNYYRVEVDLAGSVYGVGSVGIQMGGASGVVLRNGRLVAVGAWATSTDPIIDMTNATNYRSAGIEGVVVECGQICSGIDIQRGNQCHINDTHVLHFTDYGIRTRTTATDLALVNTISSEWKYGEAGWTDAAANKAARAFDIQTADFQMVNCTGSYSLTPLYIDNMSNGQITNCHFYNSSSGTDPIADEEAIYIGSAANNLMFSNCYIDKGMLHLEDSFNHTFMNCLFVGGGDNTYAIQLTTSAAGETAAELAMIGCSFASYGSNQLNLATNGGTWSALTAFTWVGNRDTDGTIAYKRFQFPGLIADVTDWQIADKNISLYKSTNGDIEVQSTVNLRLGADDGNTKAAAYSNIYLSTNGTDKVILDSDGGLYTANATGTSAGADSINIGDAYYVDNNKKADINSLYLTPLTFATLPGTPTQGQSCYITDSNTAVFNAAAAGGGANVVKVHYNGTAWVVG